MGKSFNYNDFEQHSKNFKKMYSGFKNFLYGFMWLEASRFLARVKPRTPVDTGDLRAHWQITRVYIRGDIIYAEFTNSMYYATFVEFGHAKPYKAGATPGGPDWVDGYFMMTVSLDYIYRTMPARFDKALLTYMKGMGTV